MRKRKRTLQVYLNEKEYEKLDYICALSGLTRSAAIRKMILEREIKQRPNSDFISLNEEIYRIGINVNQIALKANQLHITNDDLAEAKALMKKIIKTLDDWRKFWVW